MSHTFLTWVICANRGEDHDKSVTHEYVHISAPSPCAPYVYHQWTHADCPVCPTSLKYASQARFHIILLGDMRRWFNLMIGYAGICRVTTWVAMRFCTIKDVGRGVRIIYHSSLLMKGWQFSYRGQSQGSWFSRGCVRSVIMRGGHDTPGLIIDISHEWNIVTSLSHKT